MYIFFPFLLLCSLNRTTCTTANTTVVLFMTEFMRKEEVQFGLRIDILCNMTVVILIYFRKKNLNLKKNVNL